MTLLLTNIRTAVISSGLGLLLPACGGPAFSTADKNADSGPGGAAGTAGHAGQGGSFSDGPDAAGGAGGGVGGNGGLAGSGGTAGPGGAAGVGGLDGGDSGVNDHPDLVRPLNVTLANKSAYLLWRPGSQQVAADISGYQVCYTTQGQTAIDDASECPNSKSVVSNHSVIDPLAPNATYLWKVKALKKNATWSAFSTLGTFNTNDWLKARLTFNSDIGNGQVVPDSSGNGNNGFMVSDNADATAADALVIGQALVADGTHDYVDLTQLTNLGIDAGGQLSIEVRFRVDNFYDRNQTLFGMFNDAGSQPGIKLGVEKFGDMKTHLRATVEDTRLSGQTLLEVNGDVIEIGRFYHAVMTYTGAGSTVSTIDLFQNGVSAGSCPCLGFTFVGTDFDNASIGASLLGSGATDLSNGLIDEWAYYTHALDLPNIVNLRCASEDQANTQPMPAECL